jgi:hypothetical protein
VQAVAIFTSNCFSLNAMSIAYPRPWSKLGTGFRQYSLPIQQFSIHKEGEMKASVYLGGLFLATLTACNSSYKSFNTMSEEEIFAYNLDKPVMDQVICEQRRGSASRIRNTVCKTVRELTDERNIGLRKLQVINHRAPLLSYDQLRR